MEEYNEELKFRYQLLSRLKTDCNYFLGNGNRYEGALWAGTVEGQIKKMIELWDSFSEEEKPEWLTADDLQTYIELMTKE